MAWLVPLVIAQRSSRRWYDDGYGYGHGYVDIPGPKRSHSDPLPDFDPTMPPKELVIAVIVLAVLAVMIAVAVTIVAFI